MRGIVVVDDRNPLEGSAESRVTDNDKLTDVHIMCILRETQKRQRCKRLSCRCFVVSFCNLRCLSSKSSAIVQMSSSCFVVASIELLATLPPVTSGGTAPLFEQNAECGQEVPSVCVYVSNVGNKWASRNSASFLTPTKAEYFYEL